MSVNDCVWLTAALDGLPQRLPGALLIYGQKGIGKQRLARALGQGLLCLNPTKAGYPCGSCDGCHLFEIGNHPDFRFLQPQKDAEESGKAVPAKSSGAKKASPLINVDAIRDLSQLTTTSAHRGGARVIIIAPAESLHSSAANALLKMLEEPGGNTHFILTSNERNRVLPTIRSRCFQLPVKLPSHEVGMSWLRNQTSDAEKGDIAETALSLASYAPFEALALIEDDPFWECRQALMTQLTDPSANPLALASVSEKLEPKALGRLLSMWVFDLLALKQGGEVRYHRDMHSDLARLTERVAGAELCRWHDQVREFSRAAEHPLNRRLTLESLFATWPGLNRRLSEPALV